MKTTGKCRIGLIGAGWWAVENHIPAVLENPHAELCAVSRLGMDELRQVQDRFDIAHGYEDYLELLDAVELDGVIISSPHDLHYEHAQAALLRGRHVLVEKPFTTNARQAWELVELARANDCLIVVPCGWNFSPMAASAKKSLKSLGIGEVRHVVLQMGSALADLFGGEQMIETEGAMFRPPASTWADPNKAGGYGWGQLSHALTLLYELFDIRADAVDATAGRSRTGVDIYDAAIVKFKNGATGVLSGAATVPKQCGFQLDLRVFGSDGMFLFDVERERVEVRRHDGSNEVLTPKPGEGAYDGLRPVHRFIDLCSGRCRVNTSGGEVAARTVETLAMLYEQFAEGQA